MSPQDHYTTAMWLLHERAAWRNSGDTQGQRYADLLAEAQIHATLALYPQPEPYVPVRLERDPDVS